jgi:DNA-binding helix-hairpin-helix protein with protein kinase domain
MSTATLSDGTPLVLGPALAKAGEGTIVGVHAHPGWVAKIFHPDLAELADKLDKVAAMAACQPPGAVQPDGFTVLIWPLQVIYASGRPIGYVMPRIDTTTAVEIHRISNPADRLDPLPTAPQWTKTATWGHLVNVAANLCLAVQTVHRVDAAIGDFQERNILVANTTRVTLVDCDSMQFTSVDGRAYRCGVGRPEFTAPELFGFNLREQDRQQPSDLFALAVHIHLLLMGGNHPFLRGQWTGDGEQQQPDAATLARLGEWSGAEHSRLRSHPLAPSVDFLPDELVELFGRAFTASINEPERRPTAAEWRAALGHVHVVMCGRAQHQVPRGASCPWCAIDDERARRRGTSTTGNRVPAAAVAVAAPQAHHFSAATRRSSAKEWALIVAIALFVVTIVAGLAYVVAEVGAR